MHRKVVKFPSLEIMKNEQDTAQCNFEAGPALHGDVRPDDLQRSFPTKTILNRKKIICNYCFEKTENGFFKFYKYIRCTTFIFFFLSFSFIFLSFPFSLLFPSFPRKLR